MPKEDSMLFRLIYASTINHLVLNQQSKINSVTADILKNAHAHNPNFDINGVLFYGEGYFFQCLEGPKKYVDDLFHKISFDQRHKNITVLLASYINRKYFGQWSMKLVEDDQSVKNHLSSIGFKFFNPYLLNSKATNSLLKLFININ